MNQKNTFEVMSTEVMDACINAIESSIDHFTAAKHNMQELNAFLQDDAGLPKKQITFKPQPQNYEPLCISKVNYIAVLSLEQLGIESPTQEQIDTMESVILLAMKPEKMSSETIDLCLGENNVAKRILLRFLKEGKL